MQALSRRMSALTTRPTYKRLAADPTRARTDSSATAPRRNTRPPAARDHEIKARPCPSSVSSGSLLIECSQVKAVSTSGRTSRRSRPRAADPGQRCSHPGCRAWRGQCAASLRRGCPPLSIYSGVHLPWQARCRRSRLASTPGAVHAGHQLVYQAAVGRGFHHSPGDQRAELWSAQFAAKQQGIARWASTACPGAAGARRFAASRPRSSDCGPRAVFALRHPIRLGPRPEQAYRQRAMLAQRLGRLGRIQPLPGAAPAGKGDDALPQTLLFISKVECVVISSRSVHQRVAIHRQIIAQRHREAPARSQACPRCAGSQTPIRTDRGAALDDWWRRAGRTFGFEIHHHLAGDGLHRVDAGGERQHAGQAHVAQLAFPGAQRGPTPGARCRAAPACGLSPRLTSAGLRAAAALPGRPGVRSCCRPTADQ